MTEILPSGLYRVRLDDGPTVVVHAARTVDRNYVRVIVGDRVAVELSPTDRARGRITRKI